MAVGTDQRVGIRDAVLGEYSLGEIFQVDLMHDAGGWWNDSKVVEGLRTPAEELITLLIALKFQIDVLLQRATRSERIDLHRVVDDQVTRDERIDLLGIATHANHRRSQCREIDNSRHASEVLQDDSTRHEGQLNLRRLRSVPICQCLHVIGGHHKVIDIPQQRFEQHSN